MPHILFLLPLLACPNLSPPEDCFLHPTPLCIFVLFAPAVFSTHVASMRFWLGPKPPSSEAGSMCRGRAPSSRRDSCPGYSARPEILTSLAAAALAARTAHVHAEPGRPAAIAHAHPRRRAANLVRYSSVDWTVTMPRATKLSINTSSKCPSATVTLDRFHLCSVLIIIRNESNLLHRKDEVKRFFAQLTFSG